MPRTRRPAAADPAPRIPDEPPPLTRSQAKLQRWIDLLAALLASRAPRTFATLVAEVPGYLAVADGKSRRRAFERDKGELRAFGVPIETVGEEGSDETGYRLRTADFYLPYLSVRLPDGPRAPRRVDRYGYHALGALAFEPDELGVVADAARRARALGDPSLAADAESGMRKLAFDLPVDAAAPDTSDDARLHVRGTRARPAVLAALGDALHARRRTTFEYHTMGRDTRERRDVEPYGLFFLNGHWYLAAHDRDRAALRNFRVSRIADVRPAPGGAAAAYEIPAGFDLRAHARSRQAWELGDGESVDALVEFRGASGAARAGAALGAAVDADGGADADALAASAAAAPDGSPVRRRFLVRRPDAFARWLLAFAGEAVPVAPPELVARFDALVAATLAAHDAAAHDADAPHTPEAAR